MLQRLLSKAEQRGKTVQKAYHCRMARRYDLGSPSLAYMISADHFAGSASASQSRIMCGFVSPHPPSVSGWQPLRCTSSSGQMSQVPVAMPPGVDPAMYQQALAYLRANPGAAQQTAEQVRNVMLCIVAS